MSTPCLPYFYSDSIADFLSKSENAILGELARGNTFDLTQEQRDAWRAEIALLQKILPPHCGHGSVFFEFSIPRMGRRADVVLLLDGVICVLEFKVGSQEFPAEDVEQVWDYALDLKNFHRASHSLPIVPILVATNANCENASHTFLSYDDKVFYPSKASAETLAGILRDALTLAERQENFDVSAWETSAYAPTPTIIQAANALYAGHAVEEISRSDAAAENLTKTCAAIESVIADCKANGKKAICFVTGVPGAGKTLVGLNVATRETADGLPAVYLSGNGPLVAVLTEALARDKLRREQKRFSAEKNALSEILSTARKLFAAGESAAGQAILARITPPCKPSTKEEAKSEVKTFIQLVHHYRDACLIGAKIENGEIVADKDFFGNERNRDRNFVPAEHVAIFDEAQRAWTQEALANFMKRKKGFADFPSSEPAFLVSCLDRHTD